MKKDSHQKASSPKRRVLARVVAEDLKAVQGGTFTRVPDPCGPCYDLD